MLILVSATTPVACSGGFSIETAFFFSVWRVKRSNYFLVKGCQKRGIKMMLEFIYKQTK